MALVSEQARRNDGQTSRAEARRLIDAAAAEAQDELNLDHRELAEALLEARDTLLVTGRVPEWFGDVDAGQYDALADD